jgi:hypothetical protein
MRRSWLVGLSLSLVATSVSCADPDSAGDSLTTFTPDTTGSGDDGPINPTTSIDGSDSGGMSADGDSTTGSIDDTGTPDDGTSSDGGEESSTGEPVDMCDGIAVPDINGLDENDDGLDGLAGCSVFVNAAGGSDLNEGLTTDEPVATIARGIEIASTFNPPRPVLVAAGTYGETVNLDSGVSLYGGYEPTTWERDVFANETVIQGQEARTVIGNNLAEAVEVDGFTIEGASFTDGGQSTYAVWIRDTPEGLLKIDYCTIVAGTAGFGADGADGAAGEDGGGGDNGLSNGNGGAGGTSGCGATGGNGGDGSGCPSTEGGDGAAGGDPTTIGTGGAPGASQCGSDCDDEGTNASSGNAGSVGVNGDGGLTSGDTDGEFGGDGLWTPPQGDLATRGNHGAGGGGGGAGGFDVDSGIFCTFDSGNGIGGGGGGGGAGGCGGLAGEVGQPGGSSFAIVAVNSSIEVTNCDLALGAGGIGGSGGNGGDGGIAGQPGGGASGTDSGGEPGNGNSGAAGGGGGGGGGGAGGCGGSAIGIASVGSAAVAINNVSYAGGTAGNGGDGGLGGIRADGIGLSAPPGADGCNGVVSDERDYP